MRSLQQGFISQRKSSGWKLPLCYCNKCSVKFISLSILALEITFLPLHFEAMEVEMQLCCHLDRARCACWKKNFLCCSSYYHIHCCFFLCIFVCSFLFILCLGFRHLDQRKTIQMPKILFLSQAITSPTEHHLPIPSSVKWLHMKWVKITNIKMSLKNYSIQNVLDLINICFIVQSISRVATLTCAKIHSGGLR